MSLALKHKDFEERDRRKSAAITFIVSLLVFLGIFFYKFTKITEKPEEITTMLINFGDNRNGNGAEDPAEEDGSLAAVQDISVPEPAEQNVAKSQQKMSTEPRRPVVKERVLTGSNTRVTTPKTEKTVKKVSKTSAKTAVTKPASVKTSSSKATTANSRTGSGDGKGTAAIGNLIKGRGTKTGTQGTNGTTGNAGDPLGGDGNGDSRIGVDRNLVGFIPGTEGRGGSQPQNNCTATGTISIAYTVDKAGNVVSARRSGGISDACVVSTSISWVKKYVKAERAPTSSTGTYRITF